MHRQTIDWDGFKATIAGIATLGDMQQLRRRSRDYFWYSPILNAQLKDVVADLIVLPESEEEVMRVAAACARYRVPVTVRGGGTGNYGQAVPLAGGVVLDMTRLNRIIDLSPARVRVEAGARIADVEHAARQTGQELLMWPSTRKIATIGGFIAGGSAGVGSVRHGVLRDEGNVHGLRIVTVQQQPQIITLKGADIQKAHHAYGTNGIITAVDLALAPAGDWVHTIALFDGYEHALALGRTVCQADMVLQLVTIVEQRFAPFYSDLGERFPADRDAVFAIVERRALDRFDDAVKRHGGHISLSMDEAELHRNYLPPAYECAYNHTTLRALKNDRGWTYLQIAYPDTDIEAIDRPICADYPDELLRHHEFARERNRLQIFAIPLVRYVSKARLYEIAGRFEQAGCLVFDAHVFTVVEGGMKTIDENQAAFRKIADPHGLMNPGKTSLAEARPVCAARGIHL